MQSVTQIRKGREKKKKNLLMWVLVEMISCFRHRSNKRQAPLEAEWSLCKFSGTFQSEGTQSPWFTLAPRVKMMPALAFHSAPVLSIRMRKSILCLRAVLFSWFRPGAHARVTLFSVWFFFFFKWEPFFLNREDIPLQKPAARQR